MSSGSRPGLFIEAPPAQLADDLRERLDADRVSMQRIDSDRRVFTVVAASGDKLFSPGSELPIDSSTQILLAAGRKCFISSDFSRLSSWQRPADLLVCAAGFRSGFTVPLGRGSAISLSFTAVGDHGRRLDEVRRVASQLVSSAREPIWQHLTRREQDLLEALERGLLFKEIALLLGISQTTAKGYARSLFRKLGAHTRGEAVYLARRGGLL
jgi:DNA-binding CsgD family transcriptional regulator